MCTVRLRTCGAASLRSSRACRTERGCKVNEAAHADVPERVRPTIVDDIQIGIVVRLSGDRDPFSSCIITRIFVEDVRLRVVDLRQLATVRRRVKLARPMVFPDGSGGFLSHVETWETDEVSLLAKFETLLTSRGVPYRMSTR